jgi:SulP family sulfate permease
VTERAGRNKTRGYNLLKPKFFTTIKGYTKKQFTSDLAAGVIVGIVALPLAIAFAIASGVSPDKGLITAVIAGFIVSFLGGSRVQIGGPTGAFVIIVYGIVQTYGINGLMIATIMAGILLIIMGVAGLGSVIKFIPHPLVVGFTSGIAVIIFSSQIKDFLGLTGVVLPANFFSKWVVIFQNIYLINYQALSISLLSLAIILVWPKISRKIPGSFVALLVVTIISTCMGLKIDTIGTKFGPIAASLPMPSFPALDLDTIQKLMGPALTIAILGAIESLLSAVVADGMIGGRHRSNMELVAQGIANIVAPLFGGIPATGAIARTATNIKNGGRTPVAGMVHAVTLLLIMLFFGKFATMIPLAALASILVVVAYNMSEWRSFVSIMKNPKGDIAVLLTTFVLTVVFDLTVAIEVGMVMAVILFMRTMAMATNVGVITREFSDTDENPDPNAIDKKQVPAGVEVYEINGPFFFGAVEKFKEAMITIEKPPKIQIIRMRNVPAIDSSGIHVLEETYKKSRKKGMTLLLSGVHTQPFIALEQSGFLKTIGEENVHGNIDDALDRAREILSLPKLGRPADFIPTVKRDINE